MIETLTDDSQILLLYLADELPEADRSLIDRRRLAEPALAGELDRLGSIQQHIESTIAQADNASASQVNVNAVARSVGRAMRQRMAEPRLVLPVKRVPLEKKVRPWLMPSALAAAVLVASLVWMNRHHEERAPSARTDPTPLPVVAQDENLDLFRLSFDSPNPELANALNANSSKKETAPQDDVSQYLLNIGSVQD